MFASVSGQVNYAKLGGSCNNNFATGLSLVGHHDSISVVYSIRIGQVNYAFLGGACHNGLAIGLIGVAQHALASSHKLWDTGSLILYG